MEAAGRVVVVTGGGSGIGAALCRSFADAGAEAVVVADRNAAAAELVADSVGGTGVMSDVTVEADVRALVERTIERHGRVDIYCSNAGVAFGGGAEAADEAWDASWRVHVMAHVYAARALLPAMIDRGDGYIVGTVSAAGLLNHVLAAPYAATKAAGLSFLEWLAVAHGEQGIRVSALCPQGVRTPMLEGSGDGGFLADGAMEAGEVAAHVIAAMRDERFLILPHAEVRTYMERRGTDHERWLGGMRRLRALALAASPGQRPPPA
jgi:NAD(P)-dependent dehydrogenase (short-subunit alcohol dehydrogenase family)